MQFALKHQRNAAARSLELSLNYEMLPIKVPSLRALPITIGIGRGNPRDMKC